MSHIWGTRLSHMLVHVSLGHHMAHRFLWCPHRNNTPLHVNQEHYFPCLSPPADNLSNTCPPWTCLDGCNTLPLPLQNFWPHLDPHVGNHTNGRPSPRQPLVYLMCNILITHILDGRPIHFQFQCGNAFEGFVPEMSMSRVGHLGWRYSRQWLARAAVWHGQTTMTSKILFKAFIKAPPHHVSIDFVLQKLFLYRSYPEHMVEQLVRILGKKLCIRKEKSLDGLLPPP